jgi:adenylate kinase
MAKVTIPNISLIGPPGSGKGSYGRLLSEALSIPLLTASTLLQKRANLDTSSGELLDDETVSRVLLNNLPSESPYFMDGFPRTMKQVELMEKWPFSLRLHAAVSLEVPREVCFQKIVGRRYCHVCDLHWNISDVSHGPFVMPPQLPEEHHECSDEEHEWIQREDDVPEIIDKRLDTFYSITEPILHHYEAKHRLLRFVPYQGFEDMPRFTNTLLEWIHQVDLKS